MRLVGRRLLVIWAWHFWNGRQQIPRTSHFRSNSIVDAVDCYLAKRKHTKNESLAAILWLSTDLFSSCFLSLCRVIFYALFSLVLFAFFARRFFYCFVQLAAAFFLVYLKKSFNSGFFPRLLVEICESVCSLIYKYTSHCLVEKECLDGIVKQECDYLG